MAKGKRTYELEDCHRDFVLSCKCIIESQAVDCAFITKNELLYRKFNTYINALPYLCKGTAIKRVMPLFETFV